MGLWWDSAATERIVTESVCLQTSCHGKVASGTQVVLHEAGADPGLAAGLGRRHVPHSAGGLLQSFAFLRKVPSPLSHLHTHRLISLPHRYDARGTLSVSYKGFAVSVCRTECSSLFFPLTGLITNLVGQFPAFVLRMYL